MPVAYYIRAGGNGGAGGSDLSMRAWNIHTYKTRQYCDVRRHQSPYPAARLLPHFTIVRVYCVVGTRHGFQIDGCRPGSFLEVAV